MQCPNCFVSLSDDETTIIAVSKRILISPIYALAKDGTRVYFCSLECRTEWIKKQKSLKTNSELPK